MKGAGFWVVGFSLCSFAPACPLSWLRVQGLGSGVWVSGCGVEGVGLGVGGWRLGVQAFHPEVQRIAHLTGADIFSHQTEDKHIRQPIPPNQSSHSWRKITDSVFALTLTRKGFLPHVASPTLTCQTKLR